MKIDKHKYKELILALCSLYRLNYFEFVKPSKSPEYIKVRAVLIYYFKQQKFTNKQISPIVKLDHSNVSRNYLFAKSRILTTKRGMYILKNIEMLIFKQSIGVGTALEQIMRDNISKK